jgi:hypothetical protein
VLDRAACEMKCGTHTLAQPSLYTAHAHAHAHAHTHCAHTHTHTHTRHTYASWPCAEGEMHIPQSLARTNNLHCTTCVPHPLTAHVHLHHWPWVRYFESVEADKKTGKKLKGSIPLVQTERVTLENPKLLIHTPGRVRSSTRPSVRPPRPSDPQPLTSSAHKCSKAVASHGPWAVTDRGQALNRCRTALASRRRHVACLLYMSPALLPPRLSFNPLPSPLNS